MSDRVRCEILCADDGQRYARRLADDLHDKGVRCVVRVCQGHVVRSAVFPHDADSTTHSSGRRYALILVMTPAAESQVVSLEVQRAQLDGVPLYPLWLDGTVLPFIGRISYDDVRDGSLPSQDFLEDLLVQRETRELAHIPAASSTALSTQARSPSVFVSYRRGDGDWLAKNIADAISKEFGNASVFIDFRRLSVSDNWRSIVTSEIEQSDLLLAIIVDPKRWSGGSEPGRSLAESWDPVRFELETAARQSVHIVPVLGSERTPTPSDLPSSLRFLFDTIGVKCSVETFDADVGQVVDCISRICARGT